MKTRERVSAWFYVPGAFALVAAVVVFALVFALAVGDRLTLGDPQVRWRIVGAAVTAAGLMVTLGAFVAKTWHDRREQVRRKSVVVVELDGLSAGDTFEGVVLPGGAIRFRGTRAGIDADNVIPILPAASRKGVGEQGS